MEIIEKIQNTFDDDIDNERLGSLLRSCTELVTPFRLKLVFCKTDQSKMEIIQSKQKEAQEKIKEMSIKVFYAMDLYYQHLKIEQNKKSKGQPFSIPLIPNDTSILKVKLIQSPDSENKLNEVDHVACALINAQKVCEESILWTIFYSELEDLKLDIQEGMYDDKKYELAEATSSVKESSEEIKIEKKEDAGLPISGISVPSKFLQIFKERGFELFDYLQSEYSLDDGSPVAKYSYIYHFLSYEQLINSRSQLKYMEFIQESYGINMSKILPENDKFNDHIQHLLSRLKSDFERKCKMEVNLN